MGDGSAQRHGLLICTDSYSLQDVMRLMNVLVVKYRLECTLRYHSLKFPRIYIRQCSIPLLRTLVRPHMHSSMLYKVGFEPLKAQYSTFISLTRNPRDGKFSTIYPKGKRRR